jgi:hypothetical protein
MYVDTSNASFAFRKACVLEEETMDFLKDVVASAPDLAALEDQPAKPRRRR